jgi:hypothetical protein
MKKVEKLSIYFIKKRGKIVALTIFSFVYTELWDCQEKRIIIYKHR